MGLVLYCATSVHCDVLSYEVAAEVLLAIHKYCNILRYRYWLYRSGTGITGRLSMVPTL